MADDEQAGTQPADEDRLWSELVAAYHAPEVAREWPAAEDVSADPAPTEPDDTVPVVHALPYGTGPRDAPATAVPEEAYVPPPPPPLPVGDPLSRLAWFGVLGGPGFLLLVLMVGWDIDTAVGLLAVVAFMAGFVTLVWRMRDDPPDDTDDGAIV